jgi:MoxR-like ATPase
VKLVRATRSVDAVATGSSVRGSLALDRAVRAWALLDGRTYVNPEDVERLFIPVLLHRIFFTPSFLAEARDRGWRVAGESFRERCFALAPPPGPDLAFDASAAASA